MKDLKKKNEKQFQFNDIRRVCKSASKELGDYCRMDNLKGSWLRRKQITQ